MFRKIIVVHRENDIKHTIHRVRKMQTFFGVKLLILTVNFMFLTANFKRTQSEKYF